MVKVKEVKRVTQRKRFIYTSKSVKHGESVDEFMARNGVFDKLLAQIDEGPHRTDWEAQLDELRM
jgi:hypothetical protein